MKVDAVSIVIPSWNGASILPPTLERLSKLKDIEYEVLIVDHGRLNRDTENLLAPFSSQNTRFRYLGLDEQLGFAGAVNYGVERARHDLVAIICNDVLVESDWLAELVKAFAQKAQSGKSPIVTSSVTRPGLGNPFEMRLNLWARIVRTGESPSGYVPFFPDGSSFLFSKKFYGLPFDSAYFLYQEDVFIGWRAWLSGQEVILAQQSRALNADGGTTKKTPYITAFYCERNRWINYFCFFERKTLLLVLPPLLLDLLLRAIFGSNRFAKIHAWLWLLANPRFLARKRKQVQGWRKVDDCKILPLISANYVDGKNAVGVALNFVFRLYFRTAGLNFKE